jgi:23S rRNA pseudouridine2605 synthase
VRLNRYLSLCGLGSRRGCEEIIQQGRVTLNGAVVTTLATAVSETDEVQVDARPVRPASGVVLALHKPRGYLCTRSDTHERMTIYALLPPKYQSLHHVGRLDKESEGLLLMTNRGDLSHRLSHPSQGVEKEYEVVINEPLQPEHLAKLVAGVHTEEGLARAERAWLESPRRLHMVLKQGLKRQIRLMLYALGYEVETLVRIRIGQLKLYGLPKGGWKELTEAEVQRFFSKTAETRRPKPQAKDVDPAELRPTEPKRTAPRKQPQQQPQAKPFARSSRGAGSSGKPSTAGHGASKPSSPRRFGPPGSGGKFGNKPSGYGKGKGPSKGGRR